MLKLSGNFSFAVGSLSTAVAIGSAGTGANFDSAAVLGAPCIHEGGAAGACAEAAGAGLVGGCDPGPAPGWAEGGTGGWAAGDGLTGGCCAQASAVAATIPAATAPNNRLREPDRMEFMGDPSWLVFPNLGARASGTHASVNNGGGRIASRQEKRRHTWSHFGLRPATRRAREKLC